MQLEQYMKVKHENLIDCLKQIGLDSKDIRVIANLYWLQQAAIHVDNDILDYTQIQRGIRQGFVLSTLLFNIYTELIFRNFDHLKGTSTYINNLHYVYFTILAADKEENLQELVSEAKTHSENAGLYRKTKTMVVSKRDNLSTDIRQ